jgi:hypothetical protein
MANRIDGSNDDRQFVEERLKTLERSDDFHPDVVRARARLRGRDEMRTWWIRRAWTTAAVAAAGLVLLALPWPRAAAQRLWDRLTLGRVEVVQVTRRDLPESVTALFDWQESRRDEPIVVHDLAEAERVAGFRPKLPAPDVLNGTPEMSVVRKSVFTIAAIHTADIERALAAAGVSDLKVPKEWEGATLTAEVGPAVNIEYKDAMVELTESPPFKLTTPPGFPVARFMEIAYRIFGKGAAEARDLSLKFEANPAWMLVFPAHDTVREVPLRAGHGIAAGGRDGMCFFWNTDDRIYIISAAQMNEALGMAVANSIG